MRPRRRDNIGRTQPSSPHARPETPRPSRSAHAGPREHRPRVRKLGRKRRHRAGVGGDPVCIPGHVAAQRALHLRLGAERPQHLHRLSVDAREVRGRVVVPVAHRRAHVPRRRRRQRHAREVGQVAAALGAGPAGEALVQPRVAGLVVADQRVEPLVGDLVRGDQPVPVGPLEQDRRILDALLVKVGAVRQLSVFHG